MTSEDNIQVNPEHYYNSEYDKKVRFIGYWHQINEILRLNPDKILEIGVGNRFVSNYLKGRGYRVMTLDVDGHLKPDFVGSVLNMPFDDSSFNVVACYEVLEHLPYDSFKPALSELLRVTDSFVILSLPDIERSYRYVIHVPFLGEIGRLITLPRLSKPDHKFDGEHYWEIGKKGFSLKKIIGDIQASGFSVKSTYRIFENPHHRFFILKKSD